MALLTDAQVRQSASLTTAYKTRANREAAKIAALIALYYHTRVDPTDPDAIERWLAFAIPRLIRASDAEADRAQSFFLALRALELGVNDGFQALAAHGMIDAGVRKSLLTMGPYDYMNKMRDIERADLSPTQTKALLEEAKQVTTKKIASAVVRHAQAGGRQTIFDNVERDDVALGWVRVTRANPCYFCAMLASRGLKYRTFREGSFDASDARFTGDGDAKVHDECGCCLKPVYTENDPLVDRTEEFAELWARWGAGGRGQTDAALRFRRGYEHWVKTGEYLTWEQVDAA